VGVRPTVKDLARAAGVSVATVDRVLNRRLPVREVTVERVLHAAQAIGYHAAGLINQRLRDSAPAATLGFLLQKRDDAFYQQLAASLCAATKDCLAIRGKSIVEYIDDLSPATIADHIRHIGERVDALAVVSVDHPHVSQSIAWLKAQGVPTFAILSDLTAECRAGYVGRDNRKEGRTAAWIISRAAQAPGKVGIIIGSHRYLCQETAEISFRSYIRENAPQLQALDSLVNLEDPNLARSATLDLMHHNRDLVGLYICGGGVDGVIAAAREARGDTAFGIVCNELTATTRLGLIDGVLTAVIATPTATLAARTVEAMVKAIGEPLQTTPSHVLVPFDLCISENI
jgi:LacI family transcriptional regulator